MEQKATLGASAARGFADRLICVIRARGDAKTAFRKAKRFGLRDQIVTTPLLLEMLRRSTPMDDEYAVAFDALREVEPQLFDKEIRHNYAEPIETWP